MPRLTRSHLNKINNINNINKNKSYNSDSNVRHVYCNDTRSIFKYKYTIISGLIYEVYNIILPEINYVENKILIKLLMNTVFDGKKLKEEVKYNRLKELISHIIDFPLYELYKEYDIQLEKLVDYEFSLKKYSINSKKISVEQKSHKKYFKYIVIFCVLFNFTLIEYMLYTNSIDYNYITSKYNEITIDYITIKFLYIKLKFIEHIILPIIHYFNILINYN